MNTNITENGNNGKNVMTKGEYLHKEWSRMYGEAEMSKKALELYRLFLKETRLIFRKEKISEAESDIVAIKLYDNAMKCPYDGSKGFCPIEPAKWSTFIIQAARSRVKDYFRSPRHNVESLDKPMEHNDYAEEDDDTPSYESRIADTREVVDYDRDPTNPLVRKALRGTLDELLKDTSEQHREVCRMHYLDGESYEYISKKVDTSKNNAQQIVFRCMKKIEKYGRKVYYRQLAMLEAA